jgi:ATP-dependent DNA ligase
MLQRKDRVVGFIEPCLPSAAKTPPAGADWLHEIKHDGFRMLARRCRTVTAKSSHFHVAMGGQT